MALGQGTSVAGYTGVRRRALVGGCQEHGMCINTHDAQPGGDWGA
jgi:hypothetical protein